MTIKSVLQSVCSGFQSPESFFLTAVSANSEDKSSEIMQLRLFRKSESQSQLLDSTQEEMCLFIIMIKPWIIIPPDPLTPTKLSRSLMVQQLSIM